MVCHGTAMLHGTSCSGIARAGGHGIGIAGICQRPVTLAITGKSAGDNCIFFGGLAVANIFVYIYIYVCVCNSQPQEKKYEKV